jgi:hypothetical protein
MWPGLISQAAVQKTLIHFHQEVANQGTVMKTVFQHAQLELLSLMVDNVTTIRACQQSN